MAAGRLIAVLTVVGAALLSAGLAAAAPARTSILTSLEVTGRVDGDVVAVAGDILLAADADVRGHVIAVFGRVEREPGAQVRGTVLGLSSLAGLTLYGSPGEVPVATRVGLRLAVAGLWLLASTVLATLFPARMRRGTWMVAVLGLRTVVLGLLVLVTALAALVAAVGLGPGLGVPLAAFVMVVFLIAKLIGVTVLGGAVGAWLAARLLRRVVPMSTAVCIGVAVLVAARTLPVVGTTVWTVVSVVALGAGVFAVALASDEEPVGVSVTSGLPRR